jgi:hypothetical protein
LAETKEVIAGFHILECSDLDEAIEVAAAHPMAARGFLDIRPFGAPRTEQRAASLSTDGPMPVYSRRPAG